MSVMCSLSGFGKCDEETYPEDDDVMRTVDVFSRPKSVIDRYYTKYFRITNGICDMVLVYGFLLQPLCCHATQHRCVVFVAVGFSICVVTLAPSHPVLSDGKLVTNVNFQLCGGNRLVNKISGKHKRGAQWLGAMAPICALTCSDNSNYVIYCGVKGQLIQINDQLMSHPELVHEQPWNSGHIGIMLPSLRGIRDEISKLMTLKAYKEAVSLRSHQRGTN